MVEAKAGSIINDKKEVYRLRRISLDKPYPKSHLKNLRKLDETVDEYIEAYNKLEKVHKDFDVLKNQSLRTRADFDNYRKRVVREQEQTRKFANEELIKELLVIVDNYERALQASAQAEDFDGFRQGIEMTHKQLVNILVNRGLKKIEAVGSKFDPNYHDAVIVEQRDDMEDHTVIEVLSDGYILNDRVVRPASVKVSKKPQ